MGKPVMHTAYAEVSAKHIIGYENYICSVTNNASEYIVDGLLRYLKKRYPKSIANGIEIFSETEFDYVNLPYDPKLYWRTDDDETLIWLRLRYGDLDRFTAKLMNFAIDNATVVMDVKDKYDFKWEFEDDNGMEE